MSIITVNGEITSEKLGITTTHEHILKGATTQFQLRMPEENSKRTIFSSKVSIENLGYVRRNPLSIADNHILDDMKLAEEELMYFKKAGGDTIVDVTSKGLGRDPIAIRGISKSVGLNIVMGCGYYCYNTHPDDMSERSAEDIAQEMVKEITVGMDDTDIRAGVIGEIGLSEEIHPNEKKVLIASAMASKETGAGIIVHVFDWNSKGGFPAGVEVADLLLKHGASPGKIAIGHVDVAMDIDIRYLKELLNRGVMLAFDNFGHEFYVDRSERGFLPGPFATDIERARMIKTLIDKGYISNILLGSDVCHKSLLHKYGGWGYDHLLTNIIPMFMDVGLNKEEIMVMLKENPRRFLDTAS